MSVSFGVKKYLFQCLHPDVSEYYTSDADNFACDAGIDLYCPEDLIVPANKRAFKVGLGVAIQPNDDIASMLCLRSSTGKNTPLRLSNQIGIIDVSYRGELIAYVDNHASDDFEIEKGRRLFQLVDFMGRKTEYTLVDSLSETERGTGGFGSTGI